MYIVIRSYTTSSPEEVLEKIKSGFVPEVVQLTGFINYYVFPAGDKIVVVNLFDSEANGQASNDLAATWVEQNIAHLYTSGPNILQGEAEVAE